MEECLKNVCILCNMIWQRWFATPKLTFKISQITFPNFHTFQFITPPPTMVRGTCFCILERQGKIFYSNMHPGAGLTFLWHFLGNSELHIPLVCLFGIWDKTAFFHFSPVSLNITTYRTTNFYLCNQLHHCFNRSN